MHHSVGTEIEATAQWLEEHAASGAAVVLRRVARQRDLARTQLDAETDRVNRYCLAWRSARRRAAGRTAEVAEQSRQLTENEYLLSDRVPPSSPPARKIMHENALMRVDLARFQNLVERAGWMSDAEPRRLWRWRNGWWELAYRKRDLQDGYHDNGWYLWGPVDGCFGEWTAPHKEDARTEADRMITKYLAVLARAER